MVCFVLFYKLCERGLGVLPIYLVDKGVPMSRLAFWTGLVKSAVYLSGSSYSGFLLSVRNVSPKTLLSFTAKLRCLPLILQFFLISAWGTDPIVSVEMLDMVSKDSPMFYVAVISVCFANFCAGMLSTACFTAMMSLSQAAPGDIQSSHYSFLATMEVLGKLTFATISGSLIDNFGLDSVYFLFASF